MSGHMVNFQGNGSEYRGYLSPSLTGSGRGVIVIQEWWGLVGHIKDVADRFAEAGFTALAPDFYNGRQTTEPDEAGTLMMALNIEDAAKVIHGAVNALLAHDNVTHEKVGVIGFCMGGQLSMFAACIDRKIGACVNFYGIHPNVHPEFEKLHAPLLGFFAENDTYASPDVVASLDRDLSALGKEHRFLVFEGRQHAFFNSDRPEVFDKEAAEDCWNQMVSFLNENI